MPWTITNWANADWSDIAIQNEFVDAFNERKFASLDYIPLPAIVAGDDVQARGYIYSYQFWLANSQSHPGIAFVVSHIHGDPRPAGVYDNAEEIPFYTSIADIFSAAGKDYSHFRRYTTHPDEGGQVAYGYFQIGDIIGPWIWEDIQACLHVMVWTGDPVQGRTIGFQDIVSKNGWGRAFGDGTAVWNAAKAAAEADYQVRGYYRYPLAASKGSRYYDSPGRYRYEAQMERVEARCNMTGVWNGCTRHADWYIRSEKYIGCDWQTYGDDVIEGRLSLFSQDEPATNAETLVSGMKISDAATMPNNPWCDEPTAELPLPGLGWYRPSFDDERNVRIVIRWNVEGGFTYQ